MLCDGSFMIRHGEQIMWLYFCRDGNALNLLGPLEGHRLGIVSVDINKPGTLAASGSLDNQASFTGVQDLLIFTSVDVMLALVGTV